MNGRNVLALALLAALTTAPAFAQQEPAEAADGPETRRERARQQYQEGRQHFEAEEYEEALAAFERSYDFERRPALLFNIGSALDRLGRTRQAVARYEAYLETDDSAANAGYVRSRLTLLRAELAEEEVGAEEEPETGSETVEVSEDSYVEPETRPPTPERPSRVGPAVLFALGGAAAVSALGTGVRALGLDEDVRARCVDGRCPEDARGDSDKVGRMALATDILAATAGAAVLGGLLWWLLGGESEEDGPALEASCDGTGCRGSVHLLF